MSRLRPINDFVLIEPSAAITETEGGIAVPETAQERPREGVILGCGPGRWEHGVEIPMEVQVGDKVQFGRYAGVEIQIDGQDLLVMREEEILGIILPT